MANLAIKGHATRGSEVIALLEMLGGRNPIMRDGTNTDFYYSIDNECVILWVCNDHNHYYGVTLEEFEKKFPYKVGDKVKQSKITDNYIGTVIRMRWDGESQIIYTVEWDDERKTKLDIIALGLQPYKEEIMKDLNLVELLRDCPTGMELDSLVFDNVTFDYVNTQQNRVYCKVDKSESVWFTPKGAVNLLPNAKCVIFPKGKTTWDGFVPPCQFKEGDIITGVNAACSYIAIYKSDRSSSSFNHYACLTSYGRLKFNDFSDKSNLRLATEEGKQKLFDAIKAKGYKWNAKTETLEKLKTFKFDLNSIVKLEGTDICYRVVEQKMERRNGSIIEAEYKLRNLIDDNTKWINVADEEKYELVPNKFDISTLKPFESKVLVRDYDNQIWIPTFWGKYLEDDSNCRYLTTNGCYKYCIPYEGNEHLLGTTNDCDEYYKTWEK